MYIVGNSCLFHNVHGFPEALTHHRGGDATRIMQHEGDYEDHGNSAGSALMYALLFEHKLLRIFDQTGERAAVYQYWGSENSVRALGRTMTRFGISKFV